MYSNSLQNKSIHVDVGFLQPVSNIHEKTRYLWRKNSLYNSSAFEPYMTFFSNNFLENSTVYSEILSPVGFHTKIRSKIVINKSLKDYCSLYILYYLPKSVFVDKYQLQDLVQFNIGNLKKVHFIWGETNLEAPVWKLQKWGSVVLIETVSNHLNTSFFVDLPIHLRYFPPKKDMFYTSDLPFPISFFSCESIQDVNTIQTPFTSSWELFHQHFPQNNTFHFLHNLNHNDSFMIIHIPVVNSDHILFVQFLTFLLILASFTYISFKLILLILNTWKFKHKKK
ncbi:unnamed protein product [Pneumocystis jirovecii]|nr:unnamed protein product [Pneumocystis jirovecii]